MLAIIIRCGNNNDDPQSVCLRACVCLPVPGCPPVCTPRPLPACLALPACMYVCVSVGPLLLLLCVY